MTIHRKLLLGAALMSLAPVALQAAPAKNNAALKDAHTVNDGGATRGANSFTEGQARTHIVEAGYAQVSALTKDANGVWRGTAVKDGHKVHVGLDFKGNVSTGE